MCVSVKKYLNIGIGVQVVVFSCSVIAEGKNGALSEEAIARNMYTSASQSVLGMGDCHSLEWGST